MSNVINLRQARKAKARADKASQAEVNRVKFGRSKAQRVADAADEKARIALLEGARREKTNGQADAEES
ncbi:MAG TPA: DUF4169 domain-containing protein [Sphingobium sp.]|jgi:hypothetical protein|uniref:DUF4169 family protein n=1 Tax=unclassified Sphingobium TaxID=2611147 RepID=UPI0007F53958|nr:MULTISPECIES: DUF4169 family protein [unclassified Sphingobium]OAN55607.1 hypothetical protein A7Q26_21860 [Sphingobium sp. TCM1]WIW88681.1 DUF4169 family protein [Sphingobium sp. V4]HAF41019.1 DUF4169 domain-containing protein [Sphingobium sp.]